MFTYLQILESMFSNQVYVGKQVEIMSSLASYCDARKLSINAEISHWSDNDEKLTLHLNNAVRNASSFKRTHFSSIKLVHKEYIKKVKAKEVIEDTFPKTLRSAMTKKMVLSGYSSFKALLTEAGLEKKHQLIQGWYSRGKSPEYSPKTIRLIGKLNSFLGLKKGALSSFIVEKKTDSSFRQIGSEYSKKMARILTSSHAYIGENPFSQQKDRFPQFDGEWQDYVNFKSLPVYHDLGVRRNQKQLWKSVRPDQNEAHRNHWHCYNDSGLICPSADRSFRCVNTFLSFLCMPTHKPKFNDEFFEELTREEKDWALASYTGLGMDKEGLSMAHLCDKALLSKFVNWHLKRQGSTHGVVDHLHTFKTITNTKDGWLYQHPELSEKVNVEAEDWKQHCEEIHVFLSDTIGALENSQSSKYSRDPKEPIREYIESKSPIEVLIELESRIVAHKPDKTHIGTYAIWARDLLLARFLRYNPLRGGTLAQLTIFAHKGGDNRGMVKKRDGSWRLDIPAIAFKNMKGARDSNYEAQLHPSVCEILEEYLSVRNHLKGTEKCPFLFRPKKRSIINDNNEDLALAGNDIGRIYRLITQKFLTESAGFGPHAVRHIVATDWLKSNPRDYVTVANILHDKLETVLNEYAHLDVNDGLQRYYDYCDSL